MMDEAIRRRLADPHPSSVAAGRVWRDAMGARLAELAAGGADVGQAVESARRLMSDDAWVRAIVAPLIATLRADPLFAPPVRTHRDHGRTGLVLAEAPGATLSATVHHARNRPAHPVAVAASGRIVVVRYLRSGGATLRRWRCDGERCTPEGATGIADGMVTVQDGRGNAHALCGGGGVVVSLSVTLGAGATDCIREYTLPAGTLVRTATLDDRGARSAMLLTLLRVAGHPGAADSFDLASRDPAPFVRWDAMREWLAFDAVGAVPRLTAMVEADPDAEIRAAAAAMLAAVARRLDRRAA